MRTMTLLLLSLMLSACNLLHTAPQPPPPATAYAQEITLAQSLNLPRLGTDNVVVRGSPDDAERALADIANARGAAYYRIVFVDDMRIPGMWYASAIFYAPNTPTTP